MINIKKKLHVNLINIFKRNILSDYRLILKIKPNHKNLIKKLETSDQLNIIHITKNLEIACLICTHKFLKKLIEFPEVEYISLDFEVYLCGNKTFSNVSLSNLSSVSHNSNLNGKDISIGLVDSGVYPLESLTKFKNRIPLFKDLINHIPYPYDDNGHGSALCSIMGGTLIHKNTLMKNSSECNFHVIKAFDKFNKSYCSLIIKALDILYDEIIENPIDILCLPFELNEFDEFILNIFQDFFDKFSNKNTLIVLPIGNNKSSYQSLKGLSFLNNCITVGGSDLNYTSRGMYNNKMIKPTIISISTDLNVPNIDTEYISQKNNQYIYPPKIKNSFVKYYGTSCSCAYICGLLALVKQKNTCLNIKDAISLLKLCCNKIEDVQNSIQGLGTININQLLT